ncbi:MAG TPA: copper chaperone PCu(A)C [Streptosporangiaceae bacterium]|jgi:copper(I)-binding protein
MPTTAPAPPRAPRPGLPGALGRASIAGLVLLVLGGGLAGCAQRAAASTPAIELATAYVGQPQGTAPTDAYLVIRNNGPADRLISARSSTGGIITLSGPVNGQPTHMQPVPAIRIPAASLTRLAPNSYHLVITGSRPMKAGTDITLTLVFARSGTFRVTAEVTNPQTGGSSYFLN